VPQYNKPDPSGLISLQFLNLGNKISAAPTRARASRIPHTPMRAPVEQSAVTLRDAAEDQAARQPSP
jgi:hypothetical protein